MEGNAQDEIGSNDGTPSTGVTFIDGKYGKAGSFGGGADSFIDLTINTPISQTDFTYLLWVKPVSNSVYKEILDNRFPGTNFLIRLNTGMSVQFYYKDVSGNFPSSAISSSLGSTDFSFISAVKNQNNMKLSINNNQIGSDVTNAGNIITGLKIRLGSSVAASAFNGQIDEVMIFNKALTDAQVKALYELDLSK